MVKLVGSSLSTSRPGHLLWRFAMIFLIGSLGFSSAAQAWWNKDWAFRKQITVDGTSKGANIQGGALDNFPVLIRLHDGVLNFADANADGSDLRFVADDDKTPLKFHVEKFDNVFNLGFIWVQVPHIAGDKPASIYLYYGNSKATATSDDMYDADQSLVYHFAERGSPAKDSTHNKVDATTPFSVDESGLIGNAAKFDGNSVMPIPAGPALAVTPGSSLTWSAWVKLATADPNVVIYGRHDAAGSFVIGTNAGSPYMAIGDGAAAPFPSVQGATIADNNWHQLTVVSTPALTTLYVDGLQRSVLPRGIPAIAGPATLGGEGGIAGAAVTQGFHGEVDELEIAKSARNPSWVLLAAGNEGAADKLVQFGADEQQSSFSTGYVGIILGSITLDGWVVIGILIVMMVLSWGIMASKGRQIGRAAKANQIFLSAYDKVNGDFSALHAATKNVEGNGHKIDADELKILEESPLMHMFHTGIEELHKRLAGSKGRAPTTILSEQSIQAIHAVLNARLTREIQVLNKRMVLLTIAIAGGPFIGLLGTVVGVMITFAAVAAAGDVNVNAIAPGIAAALAATVAGLFVAIPALFGYNYLISRVKECSVEMQVFIEAFVTGMAENYDDSATLHQMAD
jgi:biopolymer transport protein ExbB